MGKVRYQPPTHCARAISLIVYVDFERVRANECAGYRRARSVLAERPSEDSFNAPVVPIAEMSRTDDQVTSHAGPGRRRRASTPHQATDRGNAGGFLSSDSDCHLPRGGQQWAGAAAAARPRSSPARGSCCRSGCSDGGGGSHRALRGAGEPVHMLLCRGGCSAAGRRDVCLRTTSWVPQGPGGPPAPFPPAPRSRTECTPRGARARGLVVWPVRGGAGARAPAACAGRAGGVLASAERCPRCRAGAAGAARRPVSAGSWGRGDL